MILHLISDSSFADYAIHQFTSENQSSEFVLVSMTDAPIKHITCINQVRIIQLNSNEYFHLKSSLCNYSSVLSHGLFERWQWELILHAPSSVKVAWFFWGGEIYDREEERINFLKLSSLFLLRIKKHIYSFKNVKIIDNSIPIEVIKRVDILLSDQYEEYKYVCNKFQISPQYIWYNYYSIEDTLGNAVNCNSAGNDILIGNSCTFENNHLWAFAKLLKLKLSHRKIVVPLSYGDSWLRVRLLKIGNFLFGNKFMPLTTFVERNVYNEVLSKCGIVVFPHLRPQAFGNLLTALWMGAKVFISKHNLCYNAFKNMGLIFYTIEDDLNNDSINLPLNDFEKKKNRELLMQIYGKAAMQLKVNEIIKILNN